MSQTMIKAPNNNVTCSVGMCVCVTHAQISVISCGKVTWLL